jgi:hypothetical protein
VVVPSPWVCPRPRPGGLLSGDLDDRCGLASGKARLFYRDVLGDERRPAGYHPFAKTPGDAEKCLTRTLGEGRYSVLIRVQLLTESNAYYVLEHSGGCIDEMARRLWNRFVRGVARI